MTGTSTGAAPPATAREPEHLTRNRRVDAAHTPRRQNQMKSIAQIVQNNRRLLAAYEDKVQPRFLSRYAREPMDAAAVYRKLRALDPGPDAPARVLDLGCGTGWLARMLAAEPRYRRANIVGYDLSPNAIRIARERAAVEKLGARTEFHVADVLAPLAGEPGRTDEIWVCGALHQMKDAGAALGRVAGLLADGGIAYVQTFAEDPDVNERVDMAVMAKMGHRVFRGSELEDLAEANGLKLGRASHAGMVYFCTLTKKSAIGEAGK
ncbi:methyltransferase domain-containing protein [Corynebacterium simulans]|uniref:class I SAM-dependent methyltransferase n=2 Tax=Corynebacterium simulans TaxID=146827 RepID=UPI0025508368|nr:class I SAM-dependent methyltransferase [Corynebacterium simulans]MDK7139956.1 methyltransferase domain-containing protein [Corynebacterium simulans]